MISSKCSVSDSPPTAWAKWGAPETTNALKAQREVFLHKCFVIRHFKIWIKYCPLILHLLYHHLTTTYVFIAYLYMKFNTVLLKYLPATFPIEQTTSFLFHLKVGRGYFFFTVKLTTCFLGYFSICWQNCLQKNWCLGRSCKLLVSYIWFHWHPFYFA